MSNQETKSLDHEACAQPKGLEVKAALSGFLKDFSKMNTEMKSKLQLQEDRLAMIERKTQNTNRPALSGAAAVEVPHKKAFAAYLR